MDTEPVAPPADEPGGTVAAIAADKPGALLRQTREARGQSIADVVQVIRFSARQIEALERDDYASLPGSTAVRGMVRNYAKFLRLDAAPLLAQLAPAVPVAAADVRPPTNMGEAEQPAIVERVPLKVMAAAVAVLLLALAGYWYSTMTGDVAQPSGLRGAEGSSGVVTPNPVVASPVAPMLAPASAVVAGSEPSSAGVASAPPSSGGLRIEFDDRSWVEIRDATQKIIFSGEYPAGTRQNVEGKAPFQVWIGKASGVRLFMGERSIDLKPYTREEVARFSLE